MPMIEAELCAFTDRKHYVSMELVADYWKCPLQPRSYFASWIFSPQDTFVSTGVLHELKKASCYFQSTIPPPFDELQESLKDWIDDFTQHVKTKEGMIIQISTFFIICKNTSYGYGHENVPSTYKRWTAAGDWLTVAGTSCIHGTSKQSVIWRHQLVTQNHVTSYITVDGWATVLQTSIGELNYWTKY